MLTYVTSPHRHPDILHRTRETHQLDLREPPPQSPHHTSQVDGSFTSASTPTSRRNSFLGFMRTRSRAATITNSHSAPNVPGSPSMDRSSMGAVPASRGATSREPSAGPTGREPGVTRSISTPHSGGGFGAPMVVNGLGISNDTPTPAAEQLATQTATYVPSAEGSTSAKTYRIRLVPNLESQRSLAFDPVVRELLPIVVPAGITPTVAAQSVTAVGPTVNGRPPALLLKIGRFTDKSNAQQAVSGTSAAGANATTGPNGGRAGQTASLTLAGGGGDVCSGKVAFKSKVVSRSHAEIWCEPGGKFYIRDTASSSGTFLNHIRLSSPNTESRPTMLNDGDVLQLGVDYQGGTEEMFRCVKMRVEVGREWQRAANEFNTNALKQLKALGGAAEPKSKSTETPSKKPKASVTDCCICLFSVTVCQSLFIAPCSHVFHYKCIRPLLLQHHPGFSCPLCRTFANLEEDVEIEEIASRRASIISRRPSNHSIRLPTSSDNPSSPVSADVSASGQPSTSIGLAGVGNGSASVDELLAGDSQGGESGTASASEEGGARMTGSSALARQQTAVASPGAGESGDVEMDVPEAVQEEGGEGGQEASEDNTLETDRIGALPVSIGLGLGARMPNGVSGGGEGALSFSQAATPMNDTFLATLAPGMHQRLALAEEMTGPGSGEGSDVGMEGSLSASGSEGRRSREEPNREEAERGLVRGDIDMMMFT
ncbi:hypothetical protein IAR55_003325 [Kwoniella newhampshirensis]|uniref:Cytoplasmic protein n=1 Tax=Kwoniella newhampshirensis TaxID=1651941 RepID=A0AAW0YNE2_9TREE